MLLPHFAVAQRLPAPRRSAGVKLAGDLLEETVRGFLTSQDWGTVYSLH